MSEDKYQKEWKGRVNEGMVARGKSMAESGTLGREVPTGYPEGYKESKHVAAKRADNKTVESYSKRGSGSGGPLLTEIAGQKTEMGMIMYEIPMTGGQKALRDIERKMFSIFKNKETSLSEAGQDQTASPETSEKRTTLKEAFKNFCKSHRHGHVKGFSRVSQTDLLDAILAKAGDKEELNPQELAYQVGVTFEAAGDNQETRSQLRDKLYNSDLWKNQIIGTNATDQLEIPGITDQERELFPGSTTFTVPEKVPTKVDAILNPALEKWKSIIADSTERRAKSFIESVKPLQVEQDIEKVVESI